jgi:hypothetical protein
MMMEILVMIKGELFFSTTNCMPAMVFSIKNKDIFKVIGSFTGGYLRQ